MEAVFIGLTVLLYVPVQIGEKILNLGLPRKFSYTPGISYQYEVEKHENSLALKLWKRLCVVGLKSELPVFIEFFFCLKGIVMNGRPTFLVFAGLY